MSDKAKGYAVGKRLVKRDHPYPVQIDDFEGDREAFIEGLRMAGYSGAVKFDGCY